MQISFVSLVTPIRLPSAHRKLNMRAQLPLTHGAIPTLILFTGAPLCIDLKIPGPRDRGQQALNEGTLQKSSESKFKLF